MVKHLVKYVYLTHACTGIPVFLISEHLVWRNLLLSLIDIFHLQTQQMTDKFLKQTCFKPLIVLFIVIIDIILCNNRVIQMINSKVITNKLLILSLLSIALMGRTFYMSQLNLFILTRMWLVINFPLIEILGVYLFDCHLKLKIKELLPLIPSELQRAC